MQAFRTFSLSVLKFQNNLWGLGTGQEQGCRTGPPSYICWRHRSLGIDSWAPEKFKKYRLSATFLYLLSYVFIPNEAEGQRAGPTRRPYRLPFPHSTGCPDRSCPAACWWISSCCYLVNVQYTTIRHELNVTQGRHGLVLEKTHVFSLFIPYIH